LHSRLSSIIIASPATLIFSLHSTTSSSTSHLIPNDHLPSTTQQQHLLFNNYHLQWLVLSRLPVSTPFAHSSLSPSPSSHGLCRNLIDATLRRDDFATSSLHLCIIKANHSHLQASPLVAKLLASSSPQRPLARPPRCQLVVSRSLTVTSLVCLTAFTSLTSHVIMTNSSFHRYRRSP